MKVMKRIKRFFRNNREEYECLMDLIAKDETSVQSPMLSLLYGISHKRNTRFIAVNQGRTFQRQDSGQSENDVVKKEFLDPEIHKVEDRRSDKMFSLV